MIFDAMQFSNLPKSSMQQRDLASLKDILKYAGYIQDFTRGKTFEAFDNDLQCELAVIRCLEVIGEATAKISEELKAAHSEIPWGKMKGMRNILIHTYNEIDDQYVWETVTQSIPRLIEQIEAILVEDA
jgi:uncharacterized protein with HEPN domain